MILWSPFWSWRELVPPFHIKICSSQISTDIKKHWHLKLSCSQNWFLGSPFCSPRGAIPPKPRQNIFLLNIYRYQKSLAPYVKQFKKLMFGMATWGVSGEWYPETMSRYLSLYYLLISNMLHPSLSRQKHWYLIGSIWGFWGNGSPKLCQNSFVLKISTDTQKNQRASFWC